MKIKEKIKSNRLYKWCRKQSMKVAFKWKRLFGKTKPQFNPSQLVNDLIISPNINKMMPWRKGILVYDSVKILVNAVPVYGGAISKLLDTTDDYRKAYFFNKLHYYLTYVKDIPLELREDFMKEIASKSEDFAGDVIFGMIERLDNINKGRILANLVKSRVMEEISIEDFFRLEHILERIPYTDLKLLMDYEEPKYVNDGSTDILAASGALELGNIEGTSNYVLSASGKKLLKYGMCLNIDTTHNRPELLFSLDFGEY